MSKNKKHKLKHQYRNTHTVHQTKIKITYRGFYLRIDKSHISNQSPVIAKLSPQSISTTDCILQYSSWSH